MPDTHVTTPALQLLAAPDFADLDPATELGPRPELVWLPKDWLHVDASYQRATDALASRKLIRTIAEGFAWARFSPITVAERADGKFTVLDGQHRVLAALLVPAVVEVPCWVVAVLEARDQARTFVGVNADRLKVGTLALFKAKLAAKDPDALQVAAVCERAGVAILFHLPGKSGELPERSTQSVSVIRKLIAAHGEGPVQAALSILADAGQDLRGAAIEAVTLLLKQHGSRLDRARLVKVLGATDCDDLIQQARALRSSGASKTSTALVMQMIVLYDKGLKPDLRLVPVGSAA